MSSPEALQALARSILDDNAYVTLATADAEGIPWASPVWFAASGYRELFWVSWPEARHSRNLAVRPELSAVVFDSRVPIGTGRGVYLAAVADRPAAADLERGMAVFSAESVRQGGRQWTVDDVGPPTPYRLYRATVSQHWVLDPDGNPDFGGRLDHRVPVDL